MPCPGVINNADTIIIYIYIIIYIVLLLIIVDANCAEMKLYRKPPDSCC